MVLSVLNLETSEGAAVLGKGNFAGEVDTERLDALKVNLLPSSDIDVFCRCVAGEGISVECGYSVWIAGRGVFFQDGFYKRWSVRAAVGVRQDE